jgi:Protein of unknown function (DUF2889)
MLVVPERAGPANPLGGSPTRPLGSARRTTSIDTSRPDGLRRESVVDARARDLITGDSDGAVRAETQSFRATIGPDRTLIAIESDPPEPRLAQLLGAFVGPGFRAKMNATVPDLLERQSLLYALLDDLPGATLVSGYAVQRGESALPPAPISPSFEQHVQASEDMCAGWASDATIMVAFRQKGSIPAPLGPPAPELERADDLVSWHAMAPLPPQSTRRRRRLDLMPAKDAPSQWVFNSHFRDSYRDAGGEETVVHEYVVEGSLDDAVTRLGPVQTEARVLPWLECPAAVASSTRLEGQMLAALRVQVRNEFIGTTTCTHLNDAFRFVSDVLPLHGLIDAPPRS